MDYAFSNPLAPTLTDTPATIATTTNDLINFIGSKLTEINGHPQIRRLTENGFRSALIFYV